MDWLTFITNIVARVPVERLLIPPPDTAKGLEKFQASLACAKSPENPGGVAQSASTSATTRPRPTSKSPMPTTEETIWELKRRLGKELYRIEMDLQEGGRIAGKPCDCLSRKHNLGLEATAEELMSYESNPVYGNVVAWVKAHEVEFEPGEIAKRPQQYYQGLAAGVRAFRKEIMGTEVPQPMSLEEAKRLAAERAAQEVEAKWHSAEKK